MPLTPSEKDGEPETRIAALLSDLKRLEARQAADATESAAVAAELQAIMRALLDARRELEAARRPRPRPG